MCIHIYRERYVHLDMYIYACLTQTKNALYKLEMPWGDMYLYIYIYIYVSIYNVYIHALHKTRTALYQLEVP